MSETTATGPAVALVTGATSGIGQAVATRLAPTA
jgi:NADP-dependent 3-hydroxy acid dehydrogenase YdfG